MKKSRYKRAIVSVPAAFIAIQGAHAANGGGDSTANIRQPVSVTKTADLDFGTFVPGTANSVFRINPRNGNMTQRSGDAIAFGGTPTPASFDVTGTAGLRVQITRNQNRIFITRDGGTETMRINRFTYDRRRKRLNAAGEANFAVGGQIRIGANQAAGTYRGTFGVTVEYQ